MTVNKIKKRDGSVVGFEKEKITNAIFKAAKSVGGEDMELAGRLTDEVVRQLEGRFREEVPSVEDVQDTVEKVLIEKGHAKTAKAYILYRREREDVRESKMMLGVKDELKLSVNTIKVLKSRYLLKDEEGNVTESTGEFIRRVARHIALTEILYHENVYDREREQTVKDVKPPEDVPEKLRELDLNVYDVRMLYRAYKRMNARRMMKVNFLELTEIVKRRWDFVKNRQDEYFGLMSRFEFLPNSPTLMNAGAPLGQLSACFVLPVGDSLDSIFDSLKQTALIHQSGGGTGFSFAGLRHKGDMVKSTKGIASGPLSFMRVFDVATDVIKQGGCISAKSLVRTDKGVVPMARLLNCPSMGSNPTRHLVYTNGDFERAFLAEDNGMADVFRIRTEIGTEIDLTYNHKVRIVDREGKFAWKEAQELKKGDWIVHVLGGHSGQDIDLPLIKLKQHFNANRINLPSEMNPELAELLGIYMADGCLSSGGRIIFSINKNDKQVRERIEELMLKLFNLKLGMVHEKENDNSENLIFYSRDLCKIFGEFGWEKNNSLNAFVPAHIFESSAESARSFLRGLFESDGDVHSDGYPRLYSVSERLMKDVQQLLFGLGIVSNTHSYRSNNRFGRNPVFHMNIVQERSIKEFIDKINFISDRKREKLLKRQKKRNFICNDVIPNTGKLLRKLYGGPGRGCGRGRSKLGSNRRLYRDVQHYLDGIKENSSRNLTRMRLRKLMEKHPELDDPGLSKIASDEYFYSRVKNIGTNRVYTMDIMVPTKEHFVANSILVHNKRRGANMGILSIHHPDVLEFISSKDSENRILTNFNISVAITDEFMEALKNNGEYELRNPRTGELVKKLFARQVWEMITYQAWKTGDPGVIFIDEVNRHNQTPHIGRIESTNPCIARDNWVHTDSGPLQVSDLLGSRFRARVNGTDMLTGDQGFFRTARKDVYKLSTREGYSLRLTDDHPVLKVKRMTRDRIESEWCRAGDLVPSDRILLHDHGRNPEWEGKKTWEEGYLLGLLVGDGTLKKDRAVLSVWNGNGGGKGIMETALRAAERLPHRKDFRGWSEVKGRNEHRMSLSSLKKLSESLGMRNGRKAITPPMEKTSSGFYRGFLRGFFDSDGTVTGSQKKGVGVRLSQSDPERLEAVQRMLLRLGIASRIYRNRRKKGTKELPDGKGGSRKYPTRAQHELVISGANISLFSERIGFSDGAKSERLRKLLERYKRRLNRERFTATVSELLPEGIEDVFDVRVPGMHVFDANGFQIHNCGEQTLLPYESCNLGSVNLSKMLTEEKEIDWEKMKRTTEMATHFLDSVIDANRYPIQQIEFMTMANRRIGLGVMGFAEMLVRMGIPYASERALELAGKIMKLVTETARAYSVRLGKERGNFPNFRGSVWEKSGYKDMRNCAVTTIAPTGTISIIANTSSGIEPLFAVVFVRRNVLGGETELLEINPLFEQYARKHGFYSEELMKKVSKTGSLHGIEGIPEDAKRLFVTAHDIGYEHHIKMQAAFQKYTDNAVSKTINLRSEAGISDVENAYLLAHKLNCKGITIYRDQSKVQQVIHLGKGKKEEEEKKTVINGEEGETLKESDETCPVCKSKLYSAEGCFTCLSCGYSKCG